MIALCISSFLLYFLIQIIGIIFTKITNIPASFTEKLLVGLAILNSILAILSIFFPINITVLVILLVVCVFSLPFIRSDLVSFLTLMRNNKTIILLTIPFVFISLIISMDAPQLYDTSLYHLQNIKWIEEYAVVPGLANLHGRFGFNANIFLVFALTSLYDIFHQEIFSINFVLFSIFVFHYIHRLYRIFNSSGLNNIFIFNLIILFTILGLTINLSSPTPDFAAITLPLFILSSFYERQQLENNQPREYISLVILAFYSITVKLSTLPIVLLIFFIFFKYRFGWVYLIRTVLTAGFIVLPWITRNIILTGWIIYPMPMPSLDLFNFDWKVSLHQVINEKESITRLGATCW